MAGQVFQAKSKIGQPLFQGSRLSHRASVSSSAPFAFQLELAPKLGVAPPPSLGFPDRFFSGFTSATTVPTGTPSRIARPSLSARTLTSCISNPRAALAIYNLLPVMLEDRFRGKRHGSRKVIAKNA